MRAVVQRVNRAAVTVRDSAPGATVRGEPVGSIGEGLMVLVGVTHDDDETRATRLADKLWNLRVFGDERGAMNRSLCERAAAGEPAGVLLVSQFTLYGDTRKGRRPSFVAAARPEQAEPLIDVVVGALRRHGAQVATGRFRADMAVELVNDGPVTLLVEV